MENQPKNGLSQDMDQCQDTEEVDPVVSLSVSNGKQCQGGQLALRHLTQPSPGIDGFSILPAIVHPMQEVMLQFYLTDGEAYNASGARMFKPTMKPYPYQERFRTALWLPSMFYSTISRATFHYLRKHHDIDPVHRRRLEWCGIRLRTEALRVLKESLAKPAHSQAELADILAMTTSLATLEQLHGTREDAKIHQHAARQVLALIDEPYTSGQQKSLLWYECILAPESHSFFWDSSSVADRVKELNVFIAEVVKKWKRGLILQKYQDFRSCTGLPTSPFLDPGSRLYEFLSRSKEFSTLNDQSNRRSHLFCVMLYAKTMVDLYASPQTVYTYKSRIEKLMQVKELDENAALINLAWLMCTAVGVAAADDAQRRWHVAAMINAIKFMHHTYQDSIISWFFQFTEGGAFSKALRIDPYSFSYAAPLSVDAQSMNSEDLEQQSQLQQTLDA